jgi:hypothetical protein
MTTATTSVTKIFLVGGGDSQTLVADVLGANPTATTFLLNCPPGTDSDDCGTYNDTVVIGPWAKPTPPPDATTGVYDESLTITGEFTFNLHCEMNATVPAVCTTTNIGGNDDGSPTATFSSPQSDDGIVGWGYYPITITSGLEKLASATEATTSASGTSATNAADTTILTGTASHTTGSASASPTNAAMVGRGEPMAGTLALVGLVLSFLMR